MTGGPMRIGTDGRAFSSPAAGVRRYSRELFAGLLGLGEDLEIVAIGGDPASLPKGISHVPGRAPFPTNLGWQMTGIAPAARRAALTLFHAPAYTAPFPGVHPLVVSIHDVSYERHPEWYPYRRDPLRRWFYRASARAADRIITLSAFSQGEIEAAYGIPRSRIAVVPLAPAPTFTPGVGGEGEGAATLPGEVRGRRFFVHVGDLHPRRNLAVALRALVMLRARRPDASDVVLVTAGMDRGGLQGLLDVAGGQTRDALVALGPVNERMLVALYRAAVALVYPSLYEGFGLPLVEAMACATPVLAARAGASPEIVGDGGLLLDPQDTAAWADAMESVLEPDVRRDLADRALGRAAAFSWRRTALETLEVYQSCRRS